MHASATHRSPAFELSWSLSDTTDSAARLVLEYAVEAFEELYLADKLWDYDAAKKRVADPFGVYRFVAHGSLRLVFDQAPYNRRLQVVYRPLYSRVRAGETHTRRVSIQLPVVEYSALARDVAADSADETVGKVVLALAYRLRSTLDADPLPPPKEPPEVGYIVHGGERVFSAIDGVAIPVKRRLEAIPRYRLPDDPRA